MHKPLALLAALALSVSCAKAQDDTPDFVLKKPFASLAPHEVVVDDYIGPTGNGLYQYRTSDGGTVNLPIAPTSVPALKSKLTWKQKHPKLFTAAHKVRRVCVFVAPIISACGAVAQIVVLFVI